MRFVHEKNAGKGEPRQAIHRRLVDGWPVSETISCRQSSVTERHICESLERQSEMTGLARPQREGQYLPLSDFPDIFSLTAAFVKTSG